MYLVRMLNDHSPGHTVSKRSSRYLLSEACIIVSFAIFRMFLLVKGSG